MKKNKYSHVPFVTIHYSRPKRKSIQKATYIYQALDVFRSFIEPGRIDHKEFMWIMLLGNMQEILGVSELAVGTTNKVYINAKEIFQLVILSNASFFILCHNHPSGKLEPSQEDIEFTRNISAFGKMVGIQLVDHLIITSEDFMSFQLRGYLQ